MRSTLRYDPITTSSQTVSAASGAVTRIGTPKIASADDAPATFATVLARLAIRSTIMAKRVQRTPKRSRIRSVSPCPVTTPRRATDSWTSASRSAVNGRIQRKRSPVEEPSVA